MRIDLYRWSDAYKTLSPETIVHTMRFTKDLLGLDDECNLLCDAAWTTEAEREGHFWIKHNGGKSAPVHRLGMPLKDYIELHKAEVTPMNPFFAIVRSEWLGLWARKGD